MKKIAIVENEAKYRKIVEEELSSRKDLELNFYNSAEEFWHETKKEKFDLIYVDINLTHMDGIELVTMVHEKFSKLKLVMLTGLGSDTHIFSALKAGAIGYILKSDMANLSYSTDVFLNGGSIMTPTIAFRVQMHFKKADSKFKEELTKREIQIIEMIVQAETTEHIAKIFKISINTVKNHIRNIYSKLQVNSRARLIRKADEIGIRSIK